jgi:hypothetical protein
MIKHTLLCGAFLLSACVSGGIGMTVGKSLAVANAAVADAADGITSAYNQGQISKTLLQQIDGYVDKADDMSRAARCFYAQGDMGSTATLIADIGIVSMAITAVKTGTTVPQIPQYVANNCPTPAPVSQVVVPTQVTPPH